MREGFFKKNVEGFCCLDFIVQGSAKFLKKKNTCVEIVAHVMEIGLKIFDPFYCIFQTRRMSIKHNHY